MLLSYVAAGFTCCGDPNTDGAIFCLQLNDAATERIDAPRGAPVGVARPNAYRRGNGRKCSVDSVRGRYVMAVRTC
eukprot:6211832-Pleurochrysis_carterae.AAC.3